MLTRTHIQRGVTLIELMIALGMGTVLATSFFGVLYTHSLSYIERLDEVDAHQNARAAINILRRYAKQARWGMVSDVKAAGTVPLGMCYKASSALPQGNCNNVDAITGTVSADRLRVSFMVQDSEYVSGTTYGAGSDCSTNNPVDTTRVHVKQSGFTQLTSGTLAAIAGQCFLPVGATNSASDLVVIGSDDGSGDGCDHRLRYSLLESTASPTTCANGYDKGFTFGRAVVADFYIEKDGGGNPRLMMRLDPRVAIGDPNTYVVAFGVENLQVSYGIDTSQPPDRVPDNDPYCDDPRAAADGGSCNLIDPQTGSAYSTADLYNRIVAVKISISVRTDTQRPFVPGSSDGYQRWAYSTTINLRNNHL